MKEIHLWNQGCDEIDWTILYQFQGPWMCSIHVHVVLCHFQISSIKFLSICSLAISCFLVLITVTATLLEIQLSWFYKKCCLSCSLMNWIELNFCHSNWPCCCFFGCTVQSTLTNMKKILLLLKCGQELQQNQFEMGEWHLEGPFRLTYSKPQFMSKGRLPWTNR